MRSSHRFEVFAAVLDRGVYEQLVVSERPQTLCSGCLPSELWALLNAFVIFWQVVLARASPFGNSGVAAHGRGARCLWPGDMDRGRASQACLGRPANCLSVRGLFMQFLAFAFCWGLGLIGRVLESFEGRPAVRGGEGGGGGGGGGVVGAVILTVHTRCSGVLFAFSILIVLILPRVPRR